MLKIEDYDITAQRGYLTPHDMETIDLPDKYSPIIMAGNHLSGYMTTQRVRFFLDQLPELEIDDALSDAELRLLMVHYSFIVQAYVWGEETPPDKLPRNLAVPYCKLADKIGQFPLLPYSAYTLDNWEKLDPEGGVTLDNICVIQNFLGGVDENWFILVHVEIEAKAGAALAAIPELLEAVNQKETKKVKTQLQKVLTAWEEMNPVFDRMVEQCDPHAYYLRVRPYIHGWKDNPALPKGLIYEGVEKFGGKGQVFRGQTGSQSSIVPTMDALLQISHEQDPMRDYLDELHQYRPPKHRKFIEAVQEKSKLRDFVIAQEDADITLLYNQIVDHVQKFRTRHLEYAAHYINKQVASGIGNPVETGTGGTPFMKYLKKHRDESRDHFIGDYTPMNHAPLLKPA